MVYGIVLPTLQKFAIPYTLKWQGTVLAQFFPGLLAQPVSGLPVLDFFGVTGGPQNGNLHGENDDTPSNIWDLPMFALFDKPTYQWRNPENLYFGGFGPC